VGIQRTRELLYSPWPPLGIPPAITPIGQLHQSPPSPIPGDRARGKRRGFSPGAAARHSQHARAYTDCRGKCVFFFLWLSIFSPNFLQILQNKLCFVISQISQTGLFRPRADPSRAVLTGLCEESGDDKSLGCGEFGENLGKMLRATKQREKIFKNNSKKKVLKKRVKKKKGKQSIPFASTVPIGSG